MGALDGLREDLDDILGLRDDLDVGLKPVGIVTRTWSGTQAGDGSYTETTTRMLPSPHVVVLKNDLRIGEGGAMKRGDLQLKMISKNKYTEADLDFSNVSGPVEKFYEIGSELYRPIGVTEKHVTWSVMLRRSNDQSREQ